MEYLVRAYTNEGDLVLDNCMGSGTTGVACATPAGGSLAWSKTRVLRDSQERVEATYRERAPNPVNDNDEDWNS